MIDKNFGVLTMATKDDYLKAIGLSISFKISNPDIPISIVCNKNLASHFSGFFDSIIIERDNLLGFQHKIFLDEYTPYDITLFLDADMLVYKSIEKFYDLWQSYPYIAQGRYVSSGVSSFGLNTEFVLNKIACRKLSDISGAGHAFFKKPQCNPLFTTARKIMMDYESYGDDLRFADEDVMNIAMTMHSYTVYEGGDFMGMPVHAVRNTLELNTLKQKCVYKNPVRGHIEPFVMHFAARQYPFVYLRELKKLYKLKGILHTYRYRLYFDAISNYWMTQVKWRVKGKIKKIFRMK